MMSARPPWRAVSPIMWNGTWRALHSMMSFRAQELSRSIKAAMARDSSICSR